MILRLASLLLALAFASATSAQEEPAPTVAAATDDAEDLGRRVEKAIADYEAVRKDAAKEAQRKHLIGWLGQLDAPQVDAYLLKELRATSRTPFGAEVVDAIGKVARPELGKELGKLLHDVRTAQPVRKAIARWMIGDGSSGCDRVLELAAAPDDVAKPNVRAAALAALAESGDERAYRGLAAMLLDADNQKRVVLLQQTNSIRGAAIISNARIKCVKDGNLIVAATAWRQLAEEQHTRARGLTLDVLERVFETPPAPAAAELVRGLVLVGDADFFPAILRFGSIRGADVRRALKMSAAPAAENRALMTFLVEDGLEAETPAQRDVAKMLLERAPLEVVQPLIERVRKELKRNRRKVIELAAGLHELLAKDPTWQQDLVTLAANRDLESRLLGLSMLLEMGSTAGVTLAGQYCDEKDWEVRSLAFRYLTRCRDAAAVPALIDRYGKEEGRLAWELDQALFAHTGTRCWSRKDWQAWWRSNKDTFVLPHPDTIKAGGSSSGGSTASYYDIPLVSNRIAFLIDHSGSMRAQVGTDKKYTRLDAAKEKLAAVVEALPKTHQCNMVTFETGVHPMWKELRKLTDANRTEFLDAIKKIPFGGGTNTFGAVLEAFEDSEVDTIYLLTDGIPTSGTITDPGEILDELQRINRTRQIVVHCIAIGIDSDLLKDIATITGGEYKYVR
ncbi:MAG: VWA domain-containing protein [Planctomycetota bacterium]